MKTSVSSYSFSNLIRNGEMAQKDTIAKALEMGFEAIEMSNLYPPDGVSEMDFAMELKEEAEKVGIPIVEFAFPAEFLNGGIEAEIKKVKDRIKVAKAMGVNLIRHDVTMGTNLPFDKVLKTLASACKEITEFAKELGVRTMVENHGRYFQDIDRVEKLYTAVDNENFGLLLDVGNFLCGDVDTVKAVGKLAPLAFHVHAKDFYFKKASGTNPGEGYFETRSGNFLKGTIIGHGNVEVFHCLKAIKKTGYNGYVTIEFEGMEDPLTGIRIGLDNLKKYISALEN